jgi:hypothetical protein
MPPTRLAAFTFCLMILFAVGGAAQVINLDPSPPLPVFDEFTRAAELAAELEAEAATLITASEAAGVITRAGLDAQASLRLIAIDLLRGADRNGEAASPAVLAAARLAESRRSIDSAIQSASVQLEAKATSTTEEDQRRIARALELLRQFNERSIEVVRRADLDNPASLDQSLAMAFAPLAEAIPFEPAARDRTPWPQPTAAQPDGSRRDLRPLIAAAPVSDDVRNHLSAIVDALDRGGEFPDLAPLVQQYVAVVHRAIDFAKTIEASGFLDKAATDMYSTRLSEAIATFREKRTRDIGLRRLDRLDASANALHSIATLQQGAAPQDASLAIAVDALLAADNEMANEAESAQARDRLATFTAIVDRMAAFRELSTEKLKGDLRTAQRDLTKAYTAGESSLLTELKAIAIDPGAMSDPSRATLIAGHAQSLEDLKRLTRLNTWIDSIGGIRPSAMNGFSNQVRKMSQWLLDPNRRPDAVAAMEHFEQQLAMFLPVPFEMQLRQGDPVAAAAAGGRHANLIAEIERQRGIWADAWAKGDGTAAAANRMLLLFRLTQSLQDLSELVEASRAADPAALLNRWGAWQMPSAAVAPAVGTIPARLKLAVESAIERDDTRLERELNAIDHDVPLAKLIGRLANRLRAELPGEANPAGETMRLLMTPMPPDAFLASKRKEIAKLCRYAMELDFARRTGRVERTEPLHRYVSGLADELLNELGERRTRIPVLTGFDSTPQDERRRPMR